MKSGDKGMKKIIKYFLALAMLSANVMGAHAAADQQPNIIEMVVEHNVMVPMRDGVRLSTDIYRPAKPGKYPTVLVRDPYGNGSGGSSGGQYWVDRGYVYVNQDVRGRYDSEGHFYPYIFEAHDGNDIQNWIAEQPWSNGNVGMMGSSYRGTVQWMSAPHRSPALKAMIPAVSPFNYYHDVAYFGGAFSLASRVNWGFYMDGRTGQNGIDINSMFGHLPLKTMDKAFGYDIPHFRDWIAHPSYDAYWQVLDVESRIPDIDVPSLNVGGWFDAFLGGTIASYKGMRQRAFTEEAKNSQRLIIGPWHHFYGRGTKTGDVDFGENANFDFGTLEERWFDQWLKGEDTGVVDDPRVMLFVMGENRWREADDFPIPGTKYVKYFLHGGSKLATKKPGRSSKPDTYTYDPGNPVPTQGGNILPVKLGAGMIEQGDIGDRDDVLVFRTEALKKDTEVTGPIKVTLYAASSALDTDFTAKLIDEHPDGKAYNLTDGIIRARYRNSFRMPELLEPGKVYEYEIDLWATSNLFKKGHRIRVDISSSNFPRFDRNPNTGHKFGEDAIFKTADQTIHHSSKYPSHITLPIIPR